MQLDWKEEVKKRMFHKVMEDLMKHPWIKDGYAVFLI